MTQTDAACLHTNQSRSYWNHLVQCMAHVILHPMLMVCTFTLVLSEVCVQCPIWPFSVVR